MQRTLITVTALLLAPQLALACAALGEAGPVTIGGEEALIVWDAATHTEHFIRRAVFKDAPASFGFLVPTPGRPALAEVSAPVFDRLFELYRKPTPPSNVRSVSADGLVAAAAVAPVQVIEQKTVAGLDATVLRASDPAALSSWLAAHHYPSSPALQAWLAPYIKRGHHVTAFKLSTGPRSSAAVRMSFQTDVPLFPYSEPAGDKSARPFRLSVVAKGRMEASIGGKPWAARVGYAAPLDPAESVLEGALPSGAPTGGWLTVFDEPRSLRGTDDLMLALGRSQQRVAPSITTRIAP